MRFPNEASPPARYGNTAIRAMIACALCVSVATAAATPLVVRQFTSMYTNFGVELPFITRSVVELPYMFWALPLITLLVWRLWPDRSRGALFALLFAIASLPVCAGIVIFALYLPIFQLGAVVG